MFFNHIFVKLHNTEAVEKQHEAMKRALHLSECNKQLENELKDIDQMALAVEAEANTTARLNAEKLNRFEPYYMRSNFIKRFNRLQESLHQSTLQIQSLEKELAEVRRQKQELQADYNAASLEKNHLQSVLETALEEKKRLSDQINQFCIIGNLYYFFKDNVALTDNVLENDLNKEIDRLVQASAAQKQKIAELECALLEQKVQNCNGGASKTSAKSQKGVRF